MFLSHVPWFTPTSSYTMWSHKVKNHCWLNRHNGTFSFGLGGEGPTFVDLDPVAAQCVLIEYEVERLPIKKKELSP
jgi:hypothetical protein